MAYVAGNLGLLAHANGFSAYRYDSLDLVDTVEAAGYFNNKDDNLNLQIGDTIMVFDWVTVVGTKGQDGAGGTTGTLSGVKMLVVTNVIADDAAANAGNVNVAEILVSTSGAISSGQ